MAAAVINCNLIIGALHCSHEPTNDVRNSRHAPVKVVRQALSNAGINLQQQYKSPTSTGHLRIAITTVIGIRGWIFTQSASARCYKGLEVE